MTRRPALPRAVTVEACAKLNLGLAVGPMRADGFHDIVPALHGRRLARARRKAIALQLGSDGPFALQGGTALGTGRGERLTRLRLRVPFRAVIAVPDWRVSTREAFRKHDQVRNGLTHWRP